MKIYTLLQPISVSLSKMRVIFKLIVRKRESLEGLITAQELTNAVKTCKRNKTPGIDGLSAEFYIIFWNKIKSMLLNAANFSFQEGCLYDSGKKGLITCIPKKDKDTRLLKNLRPITLLNTDYKLIEKVMASRLKPVLQNLIHMDQKGFLPGRKISANIRCILDILDYVNNEKKQEGILISYDFQKCFDKISHNSLRGAMSYFGFGPDFINWFNVLYSGSTAAIINNNFVSNSIRIDQGVKQGAPCSAYYFLICAEILAIKLRENKNIEPLDLGEIHKLFGQFADDLDTYSKDTEETINAIKSTMSEFAKNTGLIVNYDKTVVYRIGRKNRALAEKYTMSEMKVNETGTNILGVYVSENEDVMIEKNIDDLLIKSEAVLNCWKTRGLSLCGKITVINTLVASLYVYKLYVLPRLPDKFITKFEDICQKFIWNGRRAKISIKKLQKSKKAGGLGLVDLRQKDNALKVSWIPYLNDDLISNYFAYNKLNDRLRETIWECNLHSADVEFCFQPSFWRDVLFAWCTNNRTQNASSTDILWYNSHVKVGGKPVFYEKAFAKGLLYIHQLYIDGKKKNVHEIVKEYGLSLMQANSLLSTIKLGNEANRCKQRDHDICNTKTPVKNFYNECVSDKQIHFNTYVRWQQQIQCNMSLEEFVNAIYQAGRITTNGKLKSFQYRLLNMGILLNAKVYEWGLSDTDMCSQCACFKETVLHLFYECNYTKELLDHIPTIAKKYYSFDKCEYTVQNVLFNMCESNPGHLHNFMLLCTKYYIYTSRCKKQKVSIIGLEHFIENARKYELYNAKKTQTMGKYLQKWQGIQVKKAKQAKEYENVTTEDLAQEYILEIMCNDILL